MPRRKSIKSPCVFRARRATRHVRQCAPLTGAGRSKTEVREIEEEKTHHRVHTNDITQWCLTGCFVLVWAGRVGGQCLSLYTYTERPMAKSKRGRFIGIVWPRRCVGGGGGGVSQGARTGDTPLSLPARGTMSLCCVCYVFIYAWQSSGGEMYTFEYLYTNGREYFTTKDATL